MERPREDRQYPRESRSPVHGRSCLVSRHEPGKAPGPAQRARVLRVHPGARGARGSGAPRFYEGGGAQARTLLRGTHAHLPRARALRSTLALVLLVASLSALSAGYYGLSGASELSVPWLGLGPLGNHTLPSLLLFVVVGGSLLVAGISVLLRWHMARIAALAGGLTVLGWAALQYLRIGHLSWVQPVFVGVGATVLLLAAILPATTSRDDVVVWP